MSHNRQGLSRSIPEHIKREVRKRCGFGCIICGKFFYHYDHFDINFSEADIHDAEKIILLCADHHYKKTKGWLKNHDISKYVLDPFCKRQGFAQDSVWLCSNDEKPIIILGSNKFDSLTLGSDVIFSICKPAALNSPFIINAFFCDADGNVVFKIIENEWQVFSENWNVKIIGKKLTIWNASRKIVLQIKAEGSGKFLIEKIDMKHKGMRLDASSFATKIISKTSTLIMIGNNFSNARVRVTDNRFEIIK